MAGTRLLSQITFSTGILALLCGISLVCINFESSLTDSVTLLMKIVSDTNNKINSSSYYDILVSRDICNDCTVFISLHNAEIEHQDEYQRKSLFMENCGKDQFISSYQRQEYDHSKHVRNDGQHNFMILRGGNFSISYIGYCPIQYTEAFLNSVVNDVITSTYSSITLKLTSILHFHILLTADNHFLSEFHQSLFNRISFIINQKIELLHRVMSIDINYSIIRNLNWESFYMFNNSNSYYYLNINSSFSDLIDSLLIKNEIPYFCPDLHSDIRSSCSDVYFILYIPSRNKSPFHFQDSVENSVDTMTLSGMSFPQRAILLALSERNSSFSCQEHLQPPDPNVAPSDKSLIPNPCEYSDYDRETLAFIIANTFVTRLRTWLGLSSFQTSDQNIQKSYRSFTKYYNCNTNVIDRNNEYLLETNNDHISVRVTFQDTVEDTVSVTPLDIYFLQEALILYYEKEIQTKTAQLYTLLTSDSPPSMSQESYHKIIILSKLINNLSYYNNSYFNPPHHHPLHTSNHISYFQLYQYANTLINDILSHPDLVVRPHVPLEIYFAMLGPYWIPILITILLGLRNEVKRYYEKIKLYDKK